MPVPVQTPEIAHTANGITTVFAYPFMIFSAVDLRVRVDGTLAVLNVDYTVTGVGLEAGGNVIFGVAPANGANVAIQRRMPLGRDIEYQYSGDFQSPTVNRDFDRLWLGVQDINQDGSRSLRLPIGDTASTELPSLADRALRGMAFDADGNAVAATSSDASSLSVILADDTNPANGSGVVGYKLNALASAGRELSARLADYISAKDFGALGNDSADDTARILAAGTFAKRIYLPEGIYRISSVTFPQSVQLAGAGKWSTILKTTTTTGNVITFGGHGSGIRDIGFDATANRTSGAFVVTGNWRYLFLKDLHFTKYFLGIDVDGAIGVDIAGISALDGTPSSVSSGGALIRLGNTSYTGSINIYDVVADVNNPANQPSAGIRMKYVDVVSMDGVLIIHHGNPLEMVPASGQTTSLVAIANSCFDTSAGRGLYVAPATGGVVTRNSWANCTFSANTLDGATFYGVDGAVNSLQFSNCQFVGNSQIGANMVGAGVKDIYFDNSYASGNTGNGVQATSGVSNVTWRGGGSGAVGQSPGNAIGVAVDGTVSNIVLLDANLEGNTSSRISDASNKVIQSGNTPHAWEAYTVTATSTTGTLGTNSATGFYKRHGKTVDVRIVVSITTNGTGATAVRVTLPSQAKAAHVVCGRGAGVSGKLLQGIGAANVAYFDVLNYDGSYPGANGEQLIVSGTYEEL